MSEPERPEPAAPNPAAASPGDPIPAEVVSGPGGLAGLDFGSLLGAANQMFEAHAQAVTEEVTGTAGGGMVEVTMTGGGEPVSVRIAPEVVDPADVAMLEDLVLAALRDATAQVQRLQSGALGGLDLGGLGDLLGGGARPEE